MLRSKIHRATVTETRLDYEGSITIDQDLVDGCGMWVGEKVTIADVDNGNRFETYTIAGERGSGIICLNGAAAKCVEVGDKVIIMAYAAMTPAEAQHHTPSVLFVDEENRLVRKASYEKHGLLCDQ